MWAPALPDWLVIRESLLMSASQNGVSASLFNAFIALHLYTNQSNRHTCFVLLMLCLF